MHPMHPPMHPSCKQTIACVSLDYLTVCLGKVHQAAFLSLRSENFNSPSIKWSKDDAGDV